MYNDAGDVDSDILAVVLSSVPDTPSIGPYPDDLVTDESQIKV